jgi:hypothetical protein
MRTETAQISPDSAVAAPRPKPPRHPGGPRPLRQGKLRLVSRQSLDGRTVAAQRFDALVAQIRRDCGDSNSGASAYSGDSDLAAVQVAMIESFAGCSVLLDDMNVKVLLGQAINVADYCTLASTMTRIGSRLGLTRKARTVETPDLGSYLQDRAEPDDDGGQHD